MGEIFAALMQVQSTNHPHAHIDTDHALCPPPSPPPSAPAAAVIVVDLLPDPACRLPPSLPLSRASSTSGALSRPGSSSLSRAGSGVAALARTASAPGVRVAHVWHPLAAQPGTPRSAALCDFVARGAERESGRGWLAGDFQFFHQERVLVMRAWLAAAPGSLLTMQLAFGCLLPPSAPPRACSIPLYTAPIRIAHLCAHSNPPPAIPAAAGRQEVLAEQRAAEEERLAEELAVRERQQVGVHSSSLLSPSHVASAALSLPFGRPASTAVQQCPKPNRKHR